MPWLMPIDFQFPKKKMQRTEEVAHREHRLANISCRKETRTAFRLSPLLFFSKKLRANNPGARLSYRPYSQGKQ